MGHNGGPDWRAMIAGEDAKAVERLSRFQQPGDLWKSYRELETKLSQRPAIPTIADDATPEQRAEYRKAIGLPEIAKEAKADEFLKAYKIDTPQGYELSNVERGMIEDYAKTAYEQGHSPREVKASVDFFFRQQAANVQAVNKIAVDKQKEWKNSLIEKYGPKEYDAQQAAAQSWIREQFDGNEQEMNNLLRAQLPGGGYLGDHPWFFEKIASMAMGDGYTDRIMANSLESNGATLLEQLDAVEKLQFSDKVAYDEATKPGGKYDKLLNAAHAKGLVDEFGNKTRRRSA